MKSPCCNSLQVNNSPKTQTETALPLSRAVSQSITFHISLFIILVGCSISAYATEQQNVLSSLKQHLPSVAPYQFEIPEARPLPSLQSSTGIWDMPTARVLPDWHVRFKYGKSEPYRYYGGAIGLFDRFEIHGQFTEVSTIEAFPGFSYGHYKDRNAGGRFVLIKETQLLPQLAIGAQDPIGTSLFPSRYIVASKMINRFDVTLGLGQGLLGGEDLATLQAERRAKSQSDSSEFDTTFLFSNPLRQTKVFGGIEYHYSPKLTLSAEYSSLNYQGMFGEPDKAKWPINLGLKYRLNKYCFLQGGYMRGDEFSYGLSANLPLDPEGLLPWKKETQYSSSEKLRWQAHEADNRRLATLIAKEIKGDGFAGAKVSVNDREIWIEFINTKYLSHPKAFGRISQITDNLAPERIETFYLNLALQGQVIQSLKTSRENLRAFMDNSIDKEAYLQYSTLTFYNQRNYNGFFSNPSLPTPESYEAEYDWFDYGLDFKIKTFLNNKAGFFKHKVFLRPNITIYPWQNGKIVSELEITLLNEFDEIIFAQREPAPTRTDVVLYEQESRPRVSMLAFDQHLPLPFNTLGRFSFGLFESAYAGVGGELFRYFDNGRFGLGAEVELVRKRDQANNFKLSDSITKTYDTYYLNLYSQIVPSLGLEAGLKIGQFLGDDFGAKLELRRTFKHFTIGAWYTKTDTDHMISDYNRGSSEKGVFIRIPISLFADHDKRGNILYTFSSFTKDPGQSVNQPSQLYPMNSYHSLNQTKSNLEDMRSK